MVEDIIYNLCNNIDILETNKKIIAYKGTSSNLILSTNYIFYDRVVAPKLFNFASDSSLLIRVFRSRSFFGRLLLRAFEILQLCSFSLKNFRH